MAYDVKISGNTYTGIDSVQIPLDSGGNVTFIDGDALTKLAVGTIESVNLGTATTTGLRSYVFAECRSLESISAPNLITTPQYFCQNCVALSNVDFFPKLKIISNYAFTACSGLTGEIALPSVEGVIGTNAFKDCTGITKFTFGFTESAAANGAGSSFNGCTALETVDLGFGNQIGASAFEKCTALENLILRRTSAIVTLKNNTPFLNGTSAVDVYVPSALISAYQANSAWSAQSAVTFKALEGSAFE